MSSSGCCNPAFTRIIMLYHSSCCEAYSIVLPFGNLLRKVSLLNKSGSIWLSQDSISCHATGFSFIRFLQSLKIATPESEYSRWGGESLIIPLTAFFCTDIGGTFWVLNWV